mmetsp:Transcript_7811/g.9089  ORF Transcript_7811/g.9089 Transcript_7811/m.9089 type:complete len:275 (+) Transcript_7811:1191-2015(+)|eukprot:CAMPEP_0198271914 /NCGR_PEP_ID=MMETSP1447-20131203/51035_1 /TAXON_ID=420782 /ORGANISM="Chaetoceros dichaeta, Strain CCMP1751" /LENGTH=274 /DNA_ID=CAMNT_0043964777 /DNA_START=1156 /DNA_END=1980 /DNA_ORIENTATION=-
MQSVEFRETMWRLGIYLVFGLPNVTSVSQEMDQLYQIFKGRCRAKTLRLFSEKLTTRSRKIVKCHDTLKTLKFQPSHGVSIEDLNPEDEVGGDTSPLIKKALNELGVAMKQPTLDNDDLSYIVNGCEGELINDRPFDFTFEKDRIIKANERVGYVPFTRAYLKNKHVKHGLGQREKNEEIEQVNEDYHKAKIELKDQGFRVDGIFDVTIATSTSIKRKEREDDQAHALMKRKGAFSVSGTYTNMGSMCVSWPAVTQVQRQQLEQEEKEKNRIQQ